VSSAGRAVGSRVDSRGGQDTLPRFVRHVAQHNARGAGQGGCSAVFPVGDGCNLLRRRRRESGWKLACLSNRGSHATLPIRPAERDGAPCLAGGRAVPSWPLGGGKRTCPQPGRPECSWGMRAPPPNKRMKLTSLSAAPGRRERRLVRHGRTGRTGSQLIRRVRRTWLTGLAGEARCRRQCGEA
jgi:hypothetical protein